MYAVHGDVACIFLLHERLALKSSRVKPWGRSAQFNNGRETLHVFLKQQDTRLWPSTCDTLLKWLTRSAPSSRSAANAAATCEFWKLRLFVCLST
jgi:hypothetical protein